LQRGFRRGEGFFIELAAAGADRLVGGVVLARGFSIGAEFLDAHSAAIGVERPLRLVNILFFRKCADDLGGRQGGRRFGLSCADDSVNFVFGWRRLRAGGIFLRGCTLDHQERCCKDYGQNPAECLQVQGICRGALHFSLDARNGGLRRLTPKSQCNATAAQPGGDLEERAEALVNSKYCE